VGPARECRPFDEVYNGQNFDVLDELVAEDVVNHSATDEHKHGIGAFRHVMESICEVPTSLAPIQVRNTRYAPHL
jgi:hypothetical protein